MRRSALAALAVLLLLSVAVPAHLAGVGAARRSPATTIAEVRLLDAPGHDGATVLRVAAETDLFVTGRAEQGYYPVNLAGLKGWLPTGSVAVTLADPLPDAAATATPEARSAHAADAAKGTETFAQDAAAHGPKRKPHERTAVRTRTKVNLRRNPAPDAPVVTTLQRGAKVKQGKEHRDGWVRVTADGAEGWMLGTYLTAGKGGRTPKPGAQPAYKRHEVIALIYAAADQYGQSREDMLRVARCESDLVPTAVNKEGGSYGIFQFKTQTWLGTPYADYDIFDPKANALAAGWMWSQGRKDAWVCQ